MAYDIWLNGEFVPRDKASIPLTDSGFRLGDVVFDTERTFDGKIFRLEDHLKRLFRSLKYLRIDPGMNMDEMAEVTQQVVDHNKPNREPGDDYMITQIVTGGQGDRIRGQADPNVAVWIDPIAFDQYSPLFDSGAHVVIPKTRSYSSQQLDPKIKHYSRLNFVLAEMEAVDVDPEAFPILMDSEGNLTEGTGYNFFVVTEGVLRTPDDGSLLQGISRVAIIDLAKQLGIPTSEEPLQPYDLYTADEAFLSSTPYALLPVSRADKREIGEEVPGPITSQLLASFSEMVGVDIVDQARSRAAALASN